MASTNADIPVATLSTPLTKAAATVIIKFFIPKTSVLSIKRESQTYAHKLDQSDIINDILHMTDGKISYRLEAVNGMSHISVTNLRRYNIIFIDDYASFEKIFTPDNLKKFDVTGYYLLIITTYNKDKPLGDIEKIFQFAWTAYIININVLLMNPDMDKSALMYTYFPYTVQKCGDTIPVMLDIFVGTEFIKRAKYFPNKLRNLHNCSLSVATFDTPPFMMIGDTNKSDSLSGFEGDLLKTLAKRLNFQLIIKIPDDQQRWGDIFENGTKTGAIKLVADREVNLTIGSFGITQKRLSVMDATLNYFQTDLIFIIPPGKPYSSFQKLFLPFERSVWIIIVAQFVLSIVLVFSLKFVAAPKRNFVIGRKNILPLLSMISVFLGGPMCYVPRRNFARTLAMIWMLGCLVIRSSYQGSLFNFLQMQKNFSAADTIEKMIERDFKFYISKTGRVYLESIPNLDDRIVYLNVANRDYYWERVRNSDFSGVLVSSAAHVAYANYENRAIDPYHIGKQQIMLFPVTLYVPKGSYLTAQLNRELSGYLASGLMSYWKNTVIDDRYLRYSVKVQEPIKMNFNHIAGGYHMCVILLGTSIIIFILELLSKWVAWIRRIFDFLTY